MNYPRILIAAPKSGSGKTTVTLGILAALIKQNIDVCSFKCGPDYIDPMFHRDVVGIPSGNLDTFFTTDDLTRKIFADEYTGDMAVIEGVMGLYDGIGGVEEQGSSYDLARVLRTPIVLVVDGRGAGRSLIAQIRGFLDYDSEKLIKGVILNKTSKSFAAVLMPLIEKELGIRCYGYVENKKDIELSSRHLGLILPKEIDDLKEKLDITAGIIEEGVDIKGLLELSKKAEAISFTKSKAEPKALRARIAVAYDEAFCFYYRENLELLKRLGAEIVFFSPIRDKALPQNTDGLILGGGYPENYLKDLSDNRDMLHDIKEKLSLGLPVLAECGGFMYLTKKITDPDGNSYEMAGFIDADTSWAGKKVRFGYVELSDDEFQIKGHEFHYYDTDNNGEAFVAKKPAGNRKYMCIHHKNGSYMGFPHLYYPSCPDFAEKFLDEAAKH
ncbi:MAG: cobyrinate a,c-diamide synthase [Butyrivibrio sp.]|nr:cobyrinate a,c-diamide synthase [Butyrivibrio sp.]